MVDSEALEGHTDAESSEGVSGPVDSPSRAPAANGEAPATADDVLAFQRGPGRPPGYPRAPNSGRKPGQRNKRTLLGEDALRTLEPQAKRALRELLKSKDDGLRLKAASLVLAYCFGKPIESVRSENVNVSADVSDDKSLDRFELARRLALIFTRGDPLADARARDGPAVAPIAATQASAFSAFAQNGPDGAWHTRMPQGDPSSPPFGWFIRPDAGGSFAVIHMGETKAQCPTEAKAIKAAWAMARGQPVPAEVVPEDDGELKAPPIDCRLVFHAVEGMAIACSAAPRPGLPRQYRILDGRGQLVRTGNFSSLVKFLEERHGGPLPTGEMRTEESFRGPDPVQFDQREPAPPVPTVTRSHQVKRDFLP